MTRLCFLIESNRCKRIDQRAVCSSRAFRTIICVAHLSLNYFRICFVFLFATIGFFMTYGGFPSALEPTPPQCGIKRTLNSWPKPDILWACQRCSPTRNTCHYYTLVVVIDNLVVIKTTTTGRSRIPDDHRGNINRRFGQTPQWL